jgi:hypothetical protein
MSAVGRLSLFLENENPFVSFTFRIPVWNRPVSTQHLPRSQRDAAVPGQKHTVRVPTRPSC